MSERVCEPAGEPAAECPATAGSGSGEAVDGRQVRIRTDQMLRAAGGVSLQELERDFEEEDVYRSASVSYGTLKNHPSMPAAADMPGFDAFAMDAVDAAGHLVHAAPRKAGPRPLRKSSPTLVSLTIPLVRPDAVLCPTHLRCKLPATQLFKRSLLAFVDADAAQSFSSASATFSVAVAWPRRCTASIQMLQDAARDELVLVCRRCRGDAIAFARLFECLRARVLRNCAAKSVPGTTCASRVPLPLASERWEVQDAAAEAASAAGADADADAASQAGDACEAPAAELSAVDSEVLDTVQEALDLAEYSGAVHDMEEALDMSEQLLREQPARRALAAMPVTVRVLARAARSRDSHLRAGGMRCLALLAADSETRGALAAAGVAATLASGVADETSGSPMRMLAARGHTDALRHLSRGAPELLGDHAADVLSRVRSLAHKGSRVCVDSHMPQFGLRPAAAVH